MRGDNRLRYIPDKSKRIVSDTIWSVAGLTLMNVAAQFVVYPYWNRVLGSENYGNVVYLLGVMNILAISIGSGINYTRMRQSADGKTANKPYNIMMAGGNIASLFVLLFLKVTGLIQINKPEFILFSILTVIVTWRYYADVEYRLSINYKGYFLYYLVIGIGYLVGILLFDITRLWPFALLPGEVAGILLVLIKGSILRENEVDRDEDSFAQFKPAANLALLLVSTNLLSHLLFNGDRIILQLFAGSTAVTIYYIASLFGKTMTLVATPLNSVLVGHLAKYQANLTIKMMNLVTGVSATLIILATIICSIVSLWFLPKLYPVDFIEAKQYLFLANATQVIYFVGNVLAASILLRFTSVRNQMTINIVHGMLFVVICIPITWRFGILGFCWSLLVVNLIRYVFCVILGYLGARRTSIDVK